MAGEDHHGKRAAEDLSKEEVLVGQWLRYMR